jgi:hypothetical protein
MARIFARRGSPARFYPESGDWPVDCTVRYEFAGRIDVDHGAQDNALIKVLWTEFPAMPQGRFVILGSDGEPVDGREWKVLEQLGKLDGHLEGVQRVLRCGADRTFKVKG